MDEKANANHWRLCSSCKKPIGFKTKYFECSVSTCTGKRTGLVFCKVECWERHLPGARHRDAGAIEKLSPSAEAWAAEQGAGSSATNEGGSGRRIIVRPQNTSHTATAPRASAISSMENEILVVASKVRQYVKDRADMNTSQEVYETLSEYLRKILDQMMNNARTDGRKTIMSRDFTE